MWFYILGYFAVGVMLWFVVDFIAMAYDLVGAEILGYIVAWPVFMGFYVWLGVKFLFTGWLWCMANLVDGFVGAWKEVIRDA